MLDVRRYSPAEAREFYEQIRTANSQQQFAILMGSPGYLSRIWPGEGTAGDTARGQWGEAVKRFVAAA
jgi:hypothetical protein